MVPSKPRSSTIEKGISREVAIFSNVTLSIATFGGAAPALKLSDQCFDFKGEFSASAGNEALLDPFEFTCSAASFDVSRFPRSA